MGSLFKKKGSKHWQMGVWIGGRQQCKTPFAKLCQLRRPDSTCDVQSFSPSVASQFRSVKQLCQGER